MCGYGVHLAHMVSFGGLFHFFCSVVGLIFVFSPSSLGDVKELLGTFPRCDHFSGSEARDQRSRGRVQHL